MNCLSTFQEALDTAESPLTGLKKDFDAEQTLWIKAESSLQSSIEELEKVQVAFETERAAFETGKAALIKRAEDAEGQLKPVTEELDGLKHHISHMTQAIFGKWLFIYVLITRLATPVVIWKGCNQTVQTL